MNIKKRHWFITICLVAMLLPFTALAQQGGSNRPPRGGQGSDSNNDNDINRVSPIRRIERREQTPPPPPPGGTPLPDVNSTTRTIDGTGNNPMYPRMGAAGTLLFRLMTPAYDDGIATMAESERPNPRTVSNTVCNQDETRLNPMGVSSYLWQWGQFLDHDIDLTDGMSPPEPANIAIPEGDAWFDPNGTGTVEMAFNRSLYDTATGKSTENPRQQVNEITAWIDASNVYGADVTRAVALRRNDGSGMLKTSEGNFLPFNTEGLPNAGGSSAELFLAGDVRANEQLGLTAMHTLFVREHNRQARRIKERNPEMSGDAIYQQARKIVGAQMQVITYQEFLPALLGPMAPRPYEGYRDNIDASIANSFSTAAYRFGHSTLNEFIPRLDAAGNEIEAGHLPLRNAFFAPYRLATEGGIDPILRGLAAQICQDIDPFIIDDVRNFLFGAPGSGGFDLATLNIQRGRDHGLPSYNDARRAMGLPPARNFGDISSNPMIRERLAEAYEHVNDIDLWVGGLSEDHVRDGLMGPLFAHMIRDQFEALRDGDRLWYTRILSDRDRRDVENTTLADIIRRNTDIGNELSDDVFHVRRRGEEGTPNGN